MISRSLFGLDDLIKLQNIFGVDGALDEKTFVEVFSDTLGDNLTDIQLTQLFMKIDANSDGAVDWDEFMNYMFLDAKTNDVISDEYLFFPMEENNKIKKVNNSFRPLLATSESKITLIVEYPRGNSFITAGKDGKIRVWNRTDLQYSHTMDTENGGEDWVTSIVLLTHSSRLAVASIKHGVKFYDLHPHEKKICGKVPSQDLNHASPMCLSYHFDEASSTEHLCIGDDAGAITIFMMSSRTWHLCDGKLGCHTEVTYRKINRIQFQKHTDHVTFISYIGDLGCLVSSSLDTTIKVIDLQKQTVKRDFRQHKEGVYSFTWCKKAQVIASCGIERHILLWSPYSIRLVAKIPTTAPIKIISTDSPSQTLIGIDIKGIVNVWDIRLLKCSQTLEAKVDQSPYGTFLYNPDNFHLVVASSTLTEYKLCNTSKIISKLHTASICSALFNSAFQQVVSVDVDSNVYVWSIESGEMLFRFKAGNGDKDHSITAMCFDQYKRRIITGNHKGDEVIIWNFSNGSLLHTLNKRKLDATHEKISEITRVMSVRHIRPDTIQTSSNEERYILATGWDKVVHMWRDQGADDANDEYLQSIPKDRTSFHTDDITCMTFCPPNLVATGGHDGQVILCCINSGNILSRFELGGSIIELIYLAKYKLLIVGVASGELVVIYPKIGYILHRLPQQHRKSFDSLTAMTCDQSNFYLVTGDAGGYVTVWEIMEPSMESCCVTPSLGWIANDKCITCIDYVEMNTVKDTFIIVGCISGRISLWSLGGIPVGRFGQEKLWNIAERDTFLSPKRRVDLYMKLRCRNTATTNSNYVRQYLEHLSQEPVKSSSMNCPTIGDVWVQYEVDGSYGSIITITNIDEKMRTVEGWNGNALTLSMDNIICKNLEDFRNGIWTKNDYLSSTIGTLFEGHHNGKREPWKMLYISNNTKEVQGIDTNFISHSLPSEKDKRKSERSISKYELHPYEENNRVYDDTGAIQVQTNAMQATTKLKLLVQTQKRLFSRQSSVEKKNSCSVKRDIGKLKIIPLSSRIEGLPQLHRRHITRMTRNSEPSKKYLVAGNKLTHDHKHNCAQRIFPIEDHANLDFKSMRKALNSTNII